MNRYIQGHTPTLFKQNRLTRVGTAQAVSRTKESQFTLKTSFDCFQEISLNDSKWMVIEAQEQYIYNTQNIRKLRSGSNARMVKNKSHKIFSRVSDMQSPTKVSQEAVFPMVNIPKSSFSNCLSNSICKESSPTVRHSARQKANSKTKQHIQPLHLQLRQEQASSKRFSKRNTGNSVTQSSRKEKGFVNRSPSKISRVIIKSKEEQKSIQKQTTVCIKNQIKQSNKEHTIEQQDEIRLLAMYYNPIELLNETAFRLINANRKCTFIHKQCQIVNEEMQQKNNQQQKTPQMKENKQNEEQLKHNHTETPIKQAQTQQQAQSVAQNAQDVIALPVIIQVQPCLQQKQANIQNLSQKDVIPQQKQQISLKKSYIQPAQTKIGQNTSQCNLADPFFDPSAQFTNKNIVFIHIPPSPQTALFPSNHKIPLFIQPVSTNKEYLNPTLIAFLNLLLVSSPSLIQQVFCPIRAQGYSVRLFSQQKHLQITVDSSLPFDVNLFPLFGLVEQYIWPSVLFKCIAKLKGSYAAINKITFIQMYYLLTGKTLQILPKNTQNLHGQLKRRINSSNRSQNLVVISDGHKFYRISAIKEVKIESKVYLGYSRQYSQRDSKQSSQSMKNLDLFLRNQDKKLRKGKKVSYVWLEGQHGKRKMKLNELQASKMDIYCVSIQQ